MTRATAVVKDKRLLEPGAYKHLLTPWTLKIHCRVPVMSPVMSMRKRWTRTITRKKSLCKFFHRVFHLAIYQTTNDDQQPDDRSSAHLCHYFADYKKQIDEISV